MIYVTSFKWATKEVVSESTPLEYETLEAAVEALGPPDERRRACAIYRYGDDAVIVSRVPFKIDVSVNSD